MRVQPVQEETDLLQGFLWIKVAEAFLECGDEIERLREAGIVPADKPPLGHSPVMDSTDVESWRGVAGISAKPESGFLRRIQTLRWDAAPPGYCSLRSSAHVAAYVVGHGWLSIPRGVDCVHWECRVVNEVSDGGWTGASWNPSR